MPAPALKASGRPGREKDADPTVDGGGRRSARWLVLVAGALACRSSSAPLSSSAGVVRCPSLEVSASSFDVEYGGSVQLTGGQVDTSGGPPITYQWSGSGGDFGEPAARVTTYRCSLAAGPGPRVIALTARRASCSVSTQIVVVCDDAPMDASVDDGPSPADDAGQDDGGSPSDAGDGGEGGTGIVGCGLDPTNDEGPTCNQCTFDNCTTLENVKMGVTPTAGCNHLAADRDRQACYALYCCMRSHQCVVGGDPKPCWCGTADRTQCESGSAVANGPCLAEIQAAAGTTQAAEIAAHFIDPTLAVGGAVNLAICRATFCADPPTPACAGLSSN